MSAQVELPKGHPMRDAWETYSATDEYKNTRRWALTQAHVDGSLWAAFIAGYAAAQPAVPSVPEGWVPVPRVPTEAMLDAVTRPPHPTRKDGWRGQYEKVYLAMLSAAPTPEVQHGVAVTTFDKFLADESPEFRAAVDNRYQELRGEAQPQREASEAGQGDSKETLVRAATARVRALGEWDGKTFDPQLSEILRKLTTNTQEGRG